MRNALLVETGETLSDDEVVRRVVDGDSALFEILMRRHNTRIYRAVRAVMRTDDEVEDVMQQAYLNAFHHLRQFAGNAQFSTWLTRIAINEAMKRRKPEQMSADPDAVLTLVDSREPDPEHQAASSELRGILEREIAALPESFRLVLMLREVEGMSTAETAEIVGVSEDLVKTRLHRARTMLRDNLYRTAGVTLTSAFAFGNQRCDRVVAAVMSAISAA